MSVTSTPAIQYRASATATPVAANQPRRRYNLPGRCPIQFDAYSFDQDFEMALVNFPPAPKNTPAAAATGGTAVFAGLLDANAILTKVTQPAATYGGLGRFTASFARVPASWDDFVTQQATFPGFDDYPWASFSRSRYRAPISRLVVVRQRHDYFVIDPSGVLTGAGVLDSGGNDVVVVASEGSIPTTPKTEWVATYNNSGVTTPLPGSVATSLTPPGGFSNPANVFHLPTVPTIDNYVAMAAVAAANTSWTQTSPPVFSGSVTDNTSGQFCIQASTLNEYEGCIIDRVTTYAKFL